MIRASLKVANFTVRANERQSLAWKRAATIEGYASVGGGWIAQAADAYLKNQKAGGKAYPLAWKRMERITYRLEDGSEKEVPGWLARPFGIFRGDEEGPTSRGGKTYSLVYLPTGRIVATFRFARYCRALAADLARLWVRWDHQGDQPVEDPAAVLERHRAASL